MKYSYRQILDSLPTQKNQNSSWWVKLWVRRASFLFTYFFINLGFSANGVSLLSIIVTVTASVLFMVPAKWAVIISAILLQFWLVLDCVDGNIARCRKSKTVYGEFVDDMGGYFTVGFVYLAIGVCAYHFGGPLLGKGNYWVIVLGGISSCCDILARLLHKDFEHFTDQTLTEDERREKYSLPSYDVRNKKSLSFIRRRIGKEIGISGAFMPLSLLCAVFNACDVLTIFYFLFNGAALLATAAFLYVKADHFDRDCIG